MTSDFNFFFIFFGTDQNLGCSVFQIQFTTIIAAAMKFRLHTPQAVTCQSRPHGYSSRDISFSHDFGHVCLSL